MLTGESYAVRGVQGSLWAEVTGGMIPVESYAVRGHGQDTCAVHLSTMCRCNFSGTAVSDSPWFSAEPVLLFPSRRTTAKPQLTDEDNQDDEDGDEEDDGSAGAASQEAASPSNVEDDGKVVLLLQSKDGKIPLRISKQAPLSKLFEPYKKQAIQKGWLPSAKAASVKFDFDGDRLSGTETAEGLDCDNDDIIGVMW